MCHQTVSLVAHVLEAGGIPTVVVGSGRDIVEEVGVPRFLFVDFPLGNPCGKPGDVDMQRSIVGMALDLAETAFTGRTTVQAPYVWSDDDDDDEWRRRYMLVDDANRASLAAKGVARRDEQAAKKLDGRAKSG